MNVARCQPNILVLAVDSPIEMAHLSVLVAYEAVARREVAIRGNAQISRSRATGIRSVSSTVNFLECIDDVREGVTLAANYVALELNAALNHGIKKAAKVVAR